MNYTYSEQNSVIYLLIVTEAFLFLIPLFFLILIPLYDFISLPKNLSILFQDPTQIPEIIDFGLSEIIVLIIIKFAINYINPLLEDQFLQRYGSHKDEFLESNVIYGERYTFDENSHQRELNPNKEIKIIRYRDFIIINGLFIIAPILLIIENLNSVFYNDTNITKFFIGLLSFLLVWIILIFLIPFRYLNKISKLIVPDKQQTSKE